MEGYDAKFDPPLDKRLECPICLLAQREPMQTPCGHRFCSACILRALRETGPRCPVDNTKVCYHQLFKDNFAKREVLSLNVKCSAEECGCSWRGELRSLEVHVNVCDLVHIECPNCCGHSCQRKDLCPHLVSCVNKPEQCPQCSIHFAKNRLMEHHPHCSKIIVPDSIQGNLIKANETLKWSGTIKLKITTACSTMFQQVPNSSFHVSGYLTAKTDSPESFMFTGNWSSSLSVMPLNSPSAKIFWRMLHTREVQAKSFGFGLLSSDSNSNLFFKVLKKKLVDLSAVLGLHLKSGHSRTDLTIIYFYWSEPKRRLMACVAELKSHLVKQIQNRLHSLQQSNNHRGRSSDSDSSRSSASRNQSHSRSQTRNSDRPHHQPRHQQFPTPAPGPPHTPPAPSLPPGHAHMHPHIHSGHPTATVALLTPGPGPQAHHAHHIHQPQSHLISSQLHHDSPEQSSIVHPRILSWQMSQSLNGYPWRMQAGNVPFFTFPSTPPSFLPANPYPYTFAPAPPFSINQIAQVPTTTIQVPSYTGIAVPQGVGVDSMVPGHNGTTFPVAAIPSLTDEHLHPGAVAVTIANTNPVPGQPAPAAVVIQQSVVQPNHEASVVQSHDVALIHALSAPPPPHAVYQTPQIPAHIAPALITADTTAGPGLLHNPGPPIAGEGVAMGRYHGPIVTALPSHLVSVAPPHHNGVSPQHNVVGVSLDYGVSSADTHSVHRTRMLPREQVSGVIHQQTAGPSNFSQHDGASLRPARIFNESSPLTLFNDGAGPSGSVDSDFTSDNESLDSNSPSRNFASMLYGNQPYDSDDSSENPIELESGDSMIYRHSREMSDLSTDSQMSSDIDDASSSDSDSNSPSNILISGSTATVVISPVSDIMQSPPTHELTSENLDSTFDSSDSSSSVTNDTEAVASSDDPDTLSLPVLINISDSDSLSSHVNTPPSIIDLTTTSSTDSPVPVETNTPTFLPSTGSSVNDANQNHPVVNSGTYSEVLMPNPPMFVPVINQQGGDIFVPAHQNIPNDVEISQIMPRHEATQHYNVSAHMQRPVSSSTDTTVLNHSMVQITQPHHNPHIYAPQSQLPPGHIIQQQPLHNYIHHTHDHASASVFPNYPSHMPSAHGSMELQQVTALAPAQAAVVPMESTAAVTMHGHGNVHVLRWQQALNQQQRHHANEMVYSHPASHHPVAGPAIPVPPHPPTRFPSQQPSEPVPNQVPTGNFWETVMPSLDMSLQGNGATSSESELQ